jgi:hypothetical protein
VRGVLRTLIRATAAGAAAVAVYTLVTLPPRRVTLDATPPATHIVGGYHIHTVRSDGSGTVDEIAAEAARAGLRFIVFTDHGDATRAPDAPAYRHGVLCIDAVELNTREGHLVALGLGAAAPYPLAGTARDVIEDVHRLGGWVVQAHPDSPNRALRWNGPAQAAVDGIEWLNADAEWRDEPAWRLLATAARSTLRPSESIASLFSRPVRTLQRVDAAARQRPVFTLGALDAHARIGWRDTDEPRGRSILNRPTYGAMFGTLAQVAVLESPLSGDAARDAAAVLSALVHGRSYSIVRALGSPAALAFAAERNGESFRMGDRIPTGDPVSFRAEIAGAPGASLSLVANGRVVERGTGSVRSTASEPGVYRVEASWPGSDVPWIMSNPIVVTGNRSTAALPPPVAPPEEQRTIAADAPSWTIEREPSSEGRSRLDNGRRRFDYQLGAGDPRGQYAALASAVVPDAGVDRVAFTISADRPMRLSVQVRLPGGPGQRWRRSIFVDQTARPVVVRLQDFEPADAPTTRRPVVAPIQTLLFVVDTVNSRPGSTGTIWLSEVTLGIDRLHER